MCKYFSILLMSLFLIGCPAHPYYTQIFDLNGDFQSQIVLFDMENTKVTLEQPLVTEGAWGGHGLVIIGQIENKSESDFYFLPKTTQVLSKHYNYTFSHGAGGKDTLITKRGKTNRFEIYFFDDSPGVYEKNIDSLMIDQEYYLKMGDFYLNDAKIQLKEIKFVPAKFAR
jgi:hypothetical protein